VPVADGVPGSWPLSNGRREKYCQLRALMMPRVAAYKSSGWNVATDVVAGVNAARLEANPDVADRIAYLGRQGEDLIKAKRQRLEESLWHQHEADIGNLFVDGDAFNGMPGCPKNLMRASIMRTSLATESRYSKC
jgi:hypothetical protein